MIGANAFGVIFDVDGVLVDSSAAHQTAWEALAGEVGTPFSAALFEGTFGMHNAQILPLWLGGDLTEARSLELSRRKEELYRALAAQDMKPLDGVVEFIRALVGAGFRLAVGSSAPEANVRLVLQRLDVEEAFTGLSTGDQVRHGKPHPEVFLKAARSLDLPPSSCVVVEDAPQGVAAAIAAQAKVIAVTTSRKRSELADAQLVVDSLRELTPDTVRALVV